jgi:hypothetical protein
MRAERIKRRHAVPTQGRIAAHCLRPTKWPDFCPAI